MKRHNTLLTLTILTVMLPAGARADQDTRQVWRDSEAQIVHNTWGNCVRGNWENSVDVCGAPPPEVVTYIPPSPPRTIIAEADRTVYFPFNVASLTPESQQKLDSLAQRINSASDVQDAQVVGFADRIGTTSYNEALSKKRAEGVRNYLIGHNVVTENETITRWVGKKESNTQCPGKLSHEQLIQCLAPDRKVTVELKYKTIEQTQPQTNAAPIPGDQNPPRDWTGQYRTGDATQPDLQQSYPDGTYQSGQIQPDQYQPTTETVEPSAHRYPVGTLGEMPASELARMRAEQDSAAQPYVGQPPLPSTVDSHDATAQQVAAQDYQQSSPPQPSDEYRRRYLTTGE